MAYSPQARGRSERVGQSVEPSPQALVFALAAFLFAPFVAVPFVLFLLIAAFVEVAQTAGVSKGTLFAGVTTLWDRATREGKN